MRKRDKNSYKTCYYMSKPCIYYIRKYIHAKSKELTGNPYNIGRLAYYLGCREKTLRNLCRGVSLPRSYMIEIIIDNICNSKDTEILVRKEIKEIARYLNMKKKVKKYKMRVRVGIGGKRYFIGSIKDKIE